MSCDDMLALSHAALAFLNAGMRGADMPRWVTGWRYGEVPEGGRSRNFRDNRYEDGVSMAYVDGLGDTSDGTYRIFNGHGRKVAVGGWLIAARGSDGEPLVVGARAL